MNENKCVSCYTKIQDLEIYCDVCFGLMCDLNYCEGKTSCGRICQLRCINTYCVYHRKKELVKPLYKEKVIYK